MSINIPIPPTKDTALYPFFQELLRRAIDGTVVPCFIIQSGGPQVVIGGIVSKMSNGSGLSVVVQADFDNLVNFWNNVLVQQNLGVSGNVTVSKNLAAGSGLFAGKVTGQFSGPEIAKAWVFFDGTSGASPVIKGSYNVSRVLRNGTGDYTLTFATPFADANYAWSGSVKQRGVGTTSQFIEENGDNPLRTTTQIRIYTPDDANVLQDSANNSMIFFGNQ